MNLFKITNNAIIRRTASAAITLPEVKAHMRVDADDEDASISALIVTATSSNPLVVPVENIQLDGSGSARTSVDSSVR